MTTTAIVLPFGIEDNKDADRYGDSLWQIGLPDGREVSLLADRIEVVGGCLLAWGETMRGPTPDAERVKREQPVLLLALAVGSWRHAYAASVWSGSPVGISYLAMPAAKAR